MAIINFFSLPFNPSTSYKNILFPAISLDTNYRSERSPIPFPFIFIPGKILDSVCRECVVPLFEKLFLLKGFPEKIRTARSDKRERGGATAETGVKQ